jgi:hypothetical protein
MTSIHRAALALSLTALAGGAAAAPPQWLKPAPGRHTYRYEVTEVVNGQLHSAYRTDFDLEVTRDGTVEAVILKAEQAADGKTFTAVPVSEDCKTHMRAPRNGVARATLWPLSPEVAKAMGDDFLDTCAPPGVFFPLTDILNVAIIPVSGRFGVEHLERVGDTAHYEGFTAAFDRAGEGLKETTHGGEVRLVSMSAKVATIDWAPALADLDLRDRGPNGEPLFLQGTEHWAFRLELDRRTGALIRAHTTYDDLDLTIRLPNVPEGKQPKVKISRTVSIEPR